MLVCVAPCWAHTLSNCVRYSLGEFPFSEILRLCHVINAKPLPDLVLFCNRKLQDAVITDRYMEENDARMLWVTFVQHVRAARGPYQKKPLSGSTEEWAEDGLRLFPNGPPWAGCKWNVSQKDNVEPFVKLMRNLFSRNALLPLIGRWYSVESAAHYVFALF